MLDLDLIRIDGDTQSRHLNYLVVFVDGVVKVGVTTCIRRRLAELRRAHNGVAVATCYTTPPSSRHAAFKTERNLCRMARQWAAAHTREWFVRQELHYLKGTTGMFWILNNPRAPYVLSEVSV